MTAETYFLTHTLPEIANSVLSGNFSVHQKSAFDVVTDADLALEHALVRRLKEAFPQDGICGEETSSDADFTHGRVWTIDPIDGTFNFSGGLPLFGVQCALLSDGEILASALFFPTTNDLYYAEQGHGSTKNGIPMSVSKRDIFNSLVSFGDFPHRRKDLAARQLRAMDAVKGSVAKIRMFGAACVDFSALSAGATQAAVVITANVWDLAPGILLAKEAGARITNLDGEPHRWGDDGVIAYADEQIFAILREAMLA